MKLTRRNWNTMPESCLCGAEDCRQCYPSGYEDLEEEARQRDEHEAMADLYREMDNR